MALTRPVGEQLRFASSKTGSHILDQYLEASEIGGKTIPELLEQIFNPNTGVIEPFVLRVQNNVLELKTAGSSTYIPVVSYQAFYDSLNALLTAATTQRNQALTFRNEAETFKNAAATSATNAASSATSAAQSAYAASQFVPSNYQQDLETAIDFGVMFDMGQDITIEERYRAPTVISYSPTFLQTTDQFNNILGRAVFTYSEGVIKGDGLAYLNGDPIPASQIIVDGIYVTIKLPPLQAATPYTISTDYDFVRDVDGNRSIAQSTYTFSTR